jgi:large subunit ribosomal protein L5
MRRLSNYFLDIVQQDLILKLNYSNIYQLPKIKKVVLSFGILNPKRAIQSKICLALELLSGQKVLPIRAKKSNASLKITKDKIVGCKVTLRGKTLFHFLDKLIYIVLPQLPNDSFIYKVSPYNSKLIQFKIPFVNLFPELDYRFYNLQNLNVNLVTTAKNDDELFLLLTALQFPIKGKIK